MRTVMGIALLSAIGMILWWFGDTITDQWNAQIHVLRDRRSVEDTIRSTAYPLRKTDWLEFDLPARATGLRMLTNAAVSNTLLPPLSKERPRRGWTYTVEFQLMDENGEMLPLREYHCRTRISQAQDAETDDSEGPTWFQDVNLVPAQTRTVQIPLQHGLQTARRIRVRLGTCDPQVQDVVMRLYFKHERDDYEQPYAWSRLTVDARQRLCRAFAYPPDLLSPWERRNLLRWNWTALPPRGQKGLDYEHRLIYQREKPQVSDLEFLPPPDGLVCRPHLPVTIPTPAELGTLQLRFFPDHRRTDVERAQVDVQVYRRLLGRVRKHHDQLVNLTAPMTIETKGHLVEVTTDDFVICTASWKSYASPESDPPITLHSSRRKIRAFLAGDTDPLEYLITHVNQQPTPFRVTARRMMPRADWFDEDSRPANIPAAEVSYEFFDRIGRVIDRGILHTSDEMARYDQAALGPLLMYTSEPATYFFSLPLEVAKIRFHSDQSNVAIIAFTRPNDLPRTFRIPEEQSLFERRQEIQRTWFLFGPTDYRRRIEDNRCASISVQARPQAPHEELLTGLYKWEDHRPIEFAPGRYVLTERAPDIPLRDEAIVTAYCQIPVGRRSIVKWRTADGEEQVEPRLVYALPKRSSRPIRVFLDGSLYHEFVPRAQRGEIRLPAVPFSAEPMELQIVAPPDTRLYMRNVDVPESTCYLKRFVYDLSDGTLSFNVKKHSLEAEPIVLRTFTQFQPDSGDDRAKEGEQESLRRTTIQVRLEGTEKRGDGPLRGWSLNERVFEIAPADSDAAIIVQGKDMTLDQGQSCVIILDQDLPPGDYRLIVRQQQPNNATSFVSLYRIRPPDPYGRKSHIDRWTNSDL